MNKLIEKMSNDMEIRPYLEEKRDAFTNRVLFSGLGNWCLNLARKKVGMDIGATKNYLTRKLNELILAYIELFPSSKEYLLLENDSLAIRIRETYESLGYLIKKEDALITLANYGRGLKLNGESLYFGLPNENYSMSGLAVVYNSAKYYEQIKDILIRDNLLPQEFVRHSYDLALFDEWKKDIKLEFFNPNNDANISASWLAYPTTHFTIARNLETHDYYRVICGSEWEVLFYILETKKSNQPLISANEYRRLYYALKAFYKHPYTVKMENVDENYIRLYLYARLPNREQLFLSLIAWDERKAFEGNQLIFEKKWLPLIQELFSGLGIEIYEGEKR